MKRSTDVIRTQWQNFLQDPRKWQTVQIHDQLASSEANWSGSTLFAKAGYIQVQQDKG